MKFFILFVSLLASLNILALDTAEIQKILLEAFHGEPISQDLFKVTVGGYPLQVYIQKANNGGMPNELVPTKISINTPRGGECFQLMIDQNTAKLAWLGTKMAMIELDCGIHASVKKKGEYLLTFVDQIARELKLHSVSLDDVSSIYCDKNRTRINLRLLKLAKKSPGWYEQHGFLPTKIDKYNRSALILMNYSLKEIIESMDNISAESIAQNLVELEQLMQSQDSIRRLNTKELMNYWKTFAERRVLLKKQAEALNSSTFSDLAGALYKSDGSTCDLYSELIDLIFLPFGIGNDEQRRVFQRRFNWRWLEVYIDFMDTAENLVKNYSTNS